jgi:hypothetical protein
MLLKRQRNELYRILVDKNLNSNDFIENNEETSYRLERTNSRFFFNLQEGNKYSKISFYPKIKLSEGDETVGVTWEEALPYIKEWAELLNEEYNTPDLWAEAKANSKLFSFNEAVPDEMFNATELRQLEGQVRHLSQQLTSLGLPAHAQKALTATIEEIPKKATRLTKEEVRGWFMSAIVTQVTTLALSPEHVAAVGHLIKTTFMGLLQLH